MYYRVLETGGGYQAGEVLDLGDVELATQLARRVPLLRLAGRPEFMPVAPAPVAPVKVKATPKPIPPIVPDPNTMGLSKRRKRG